MKILVLVGNYRGLTQDVQVFIDNGAAAELAQTRLMSEYGIPVDDEDAERDSSATLHEFDLEVKADLHFRIQEDMGVGGEVSEKTAFGVFSDKLEGDIAYVCEEMESCKWSQWCHTITRPALDKHEVITERCPQLQTSKRFLRRVDA